MTSKSKSIRSKTLSKTRSVKSTRKSKKMSASSILFPLAFFGSLFAGGVYYATKESRIHETIKFKPDIPITVKKSAYIKEIDEIEKKADEFEKKVIKNYVMYPEELPEETTDNVIGAKEQAKTLKNLLDKKDSGNLKGVLFTGPPGTGKTMLAKAFARENNMILINVKGLVTGKIGDSVKMLDAVFSLASKITKSGIKCMILIDEIDRTFSNQGSGESARAQIGGDITGSMQTTYDDYKDDNVIFIGITNYPEKIEKAITDRLDSIEFRELTDDERKSLLDQMLGTKADSVKGAVISLTATKLKNVYNSFLKYADYEARNDIELLDKIYYDKSVKYSRTDTERNKLMEFLEEYYSSKIGVKKLDALENFKRLFASILFLKFIQMCGIIENSKLENRLISKLGNIIPYNENRIDQLGWDNIARGSINIYDVLIFYLKIKESSNRTLKKLLGSIDIADANERIITGRFFGRRKNRSKKKTLKRRSLKRR